MEIDAIKTEMENNQLEISKAKKQLVAKTKEIKAIIKSV